MGAPSGASISISGMHRPSEDRLSIASAIVMKELKENSVGTPLPGCPTAPPSIADTSGEVSLQEYLSLIVVGLPVIIARRAQPVEIGKSIRCEKKSLDKEWRIGYDI